MADGDEDFYGPGFDFAMSDLEALRALAEEMRGDADQRAVRYGQRLSELLDEIEAAADTETPPELPASESGEPTPP